VARRISFFVTHKVSFVNGTPVDDVSGREAWERLQAAPTALLIDVRTRAEWAFVGIPDLSGIGKRALTAEWQSFPDNSVDPAFSTRLDGVLKELGVEPDTELFFICRSGGRSRMAAETMTAAGYTRCHNVADGFEGPLDEFRHRGTVAGWKASGLPWVQG
jgi:rhodanese-related sulfurtransferase